MRTVSAIVDSHIRIDGNVIGHDIANEIFDQLEIPNRTKAEAKRAKRWGWQDLPDCYQLGDLDGDTLVLPRGYALELKLLLRERGIRIQWHDRRKWNQGRPFKWRKSFTPRAHQPAAVAAMRKHQQGMYEAPTGSGKSLTCVYFVHEVAPKKSIILVDKLELMGQWLADFGNWFGGEYVGQVGNGAWVDEKRITVATVQTLWRALKDHKIDKEWFDQFDCAILDECHHVTAETLQDLVSSLPAFFRIGVSATPDRLDDKFEIAQNVLGEVFHADDEEELRAAGVLIAPVVYPIKTQFRFPYWPDHDAEYDKSDKVWICQKPGCKIKGDHGHRNNYQQLKTALVSDEARNNLVAEIVQSELHDPHVHLIVSDEVRHLEALEAALKAQLERVPPIYMLTGRKTKKQRQEMLSAISTERECIILATVAKEGLNIPSIDRIYLPFPASNPKKVEQWIGRGTRVAEGKRGAIIFDFNDILVGLLKQQFRKRRWQCYEKLGMEVIL